MQSTAQIYSKILEVSEKSYYRWKSKDHKILISLIEKYFTKQELEEFLETGKIEKMENLNQFHYTIENDCIELLEFFNNLYYEFTNGHNDQESLKLKLYLLQIFSMSDSHYIRELVATLDEYNDKNKDTYLVISSEDLSILLYILENNNFAQKFENIISYTSSKKLSNLITLPSLAMRKDTDLYNTAIDIYINYHISNKIETKDINKIESLINSLLFKYQIEDNPTSDDISIQKVAEIDKDIEEVLRSTD